ncbi:hypothetical protein AVEN_242594-1 [Araneus ventricosus]|uniref:Uncharacterized protein n=1 Tax=Araneus ventricosus TaxID=182803 RepID=A0A4Y2ETE1_ARAVE|nr:hypothetical protein AVEN_242594-1 [Araneus ventricosus]
MCVADRSTLYGWDLLSGVVEFVTNMATQVIKQSRLKDSSPNESSTVMKLASFRKKMIKRTSITQEKRHCLDIKPMKDSLTFLLCANASDDCKVKPFLVCPSETPRVFSVLYSFYINFVLFLVLNTVFILYKMRF